MTSDEQDQPDDERGAALRARALMAPSVAQRDGALDQSRRRCGASAGDRRETHVSA